MASNPYPWLEIHPDGHEIDLRGTTAIEADKRLTISYEISAGRLIINPHYDERTHGQN